MATRTRLQPEKKSRPIIPTITPVIPSLLDYETFRDRIREHEKGDLIEGVIKLKTPASYEHEERFSLLHSLMRIYASAKNLGKVLGSRSLVKIDSKNGYEPDILYVANDRLDIIKTHEILGPPDVVVEIISKTSRIDDRVTKFQYYERVGVKEYWLIDPRYKLAEFYELVDGHYRQMDSDDDIFHSNALPGFWFKLDWLFAVPSPNEYALLQEIFAASPTV